MKEDKEDSSDEKPSIPKELQTWKEKVPTRNLTDLNGLAECRVLQTFRQGNIRKIANGTCRIGALNENKIQSHGLLASLLFSRAWRAFGNNWKQFRNRIFVYQQRTSQ
jgi:hypothetical protein